MNKTIFVVSGMNWDKSIAIKAFRCPKEAEKYRSMLCEYQMDKPSSREDSEAKRKKWKDNHPLNGIVTNPYRWDAFALDEVELD